MHTPTKNVSQKTANVALAAMLIGAGAVTGVVTLWDELQQIPTALGEVVKAWLVPSGTAVAGCVETYQEPPYVGVRPEECA